MSEEKKIYIAQWVFGALGVLIALNEFGKGGLGILSGLVLAVSAFIITPFASKLIDQKIPLLQKKYSLKVFLQFLISFLLFLTGIILTPRNEPVTTRTIENTVIDIQETTIEQLVIETETVEESPTEEPTTESNMEDTTEELSTELNTEGILIEESITVVRDRKDEALQEALQFVEYSNVSYAGLIEVLEFVGYSHEEAVYAADNCNADWNHEAAECAEGFTKVENFSKERLIELLMSDGYTGEQAEYGASTIDFSNFEPAPIPQTEAPAVQVEQPAIPNVSSHEYWINTDSGKFHYSDCRTIKNKEDPHWETYHGDRADLISQGYDPCGVCDP